MGVAEKLAFIRAGMETKRYHVVPTLGANTVAHHSCGVALLCMILLGEEALLDDVAELMRAALLHDLAEYRAGDMPADAKRAIGVGAGLAHYEDHLLAAAGLSYGLDYEQARLLKFADCADGALFCCRERAMGNKLVTPTFENYRRYLREFQPYGEIERGVVYFIDEEWSKANG